MLSVARNCRRVVSRVRNHTFISYRVARYFATNATEANASVKTRATSSPSSFEAIPSNTAAVASSINSQSSSSSTYPPGSPASIPGAKHVKLSVKDILAAHSRISSQVHKSPLDYSQRLSQLTGTSLYLKKEHLSITGSYKERGALNKLLQLTDDEKRRGVICSSAGNHAQAVSYHSTRLNIDGMIVMPRNTPFVKVKQTREFGAKVVLQGESFNEAFEYALETAHKQGRTFIHAFNDSDIVAGQGTLALELLEQNPFMDAVIVPIGGGGLIAGMSVALRSINPRIKIYGVETTAMPGMYQSLKSGAVVPVPKTPTMADGIAVETVGLVPYEIIKENVDDIVLVNEDEIATAVLELLEKEKTLVEGSGAASLAALMHNKLDLKDKNVVAILSGGNIDMTLLGRIIDKGLVKSGRLARVHVTVMDIPGQLAKVTSIIHEMRANVKDVEHERAFLLDNVGITQPAITMETRGFDHVHEIVERLKKEGFQRVYLETPRK